ncbi:MAG: STAS-like domain-containing protein [Candidatus Poribacteria bacterium]|nr:STAS-like domain-containing protein [Candidatus Poribacteria bacterium]
MSENVRISMFEIVGSPFCVATDDGEKVHKHLDAALKANQKVVLSFHNVTALTSAFLTTAIGELYGTFSEEKIHFLLKVEDAEPSDIALLDRVIRNTKLYFKDPQRFNQIFQEVLGDDDDEVQSS